MISDSDDLSTDLSITTSPGELLSRARLSAGLSQDEVAKELYMTLSRVCALEADDYKHINSATFVRGYLRAYANLVKLDGALVLSAYESQLKTAGLLTAEPVVSAVVTTKKSGRFIVIVTASLALLWLLSIWFFDNRPKPEYVIPAPLVSLQYDIKQESLDTKTEATFDVQKSLGTSVSADVKPEDESTKDVKGNVAPVTTLVSTLKTPGTSDASTFLDVIDFTFSEECWLEVSDSRGDVLATELQLAGSHLTLQGAAPFNVKLGNASGVQILLNRTPVTISPMEGTNVLEIKVGAE